MMRKVFFTLGVFRTSFHQFKPVQNLSFMRFYSKKKGKGDDDVPSGPPPDLNFQKALGPDMEKYIKAFQTQLSTMKTGKISPSQLESIKVKLANGETHPMKALASIIVKSPKQIVISAYDKSTCNPIESALYAEELGLSVVIDKNNVNVTVPQMTKELREAAVKQAKKYAEMTKDNVRNVRHDGQKLLKAAKDKVSKDDLYKAEQALQKITDEYTKKIDTILEAKEKEVLKL